MRLVGRCIRASRWLRSRFKPKDVVELSIKRSEIQRFALRVPYVRQGKLLAWMNGRWISLDITIIEDGESAPNNLVVMRRLRRVK